MIRFNCPANTGRELSYIKQAIEESTKICGDGPFTKKCNELIEQKFGAKKALLTTSCTHALEMSAILCGIEPGDEVIMPSFTFVSTANAFVRSGARIVFVDIRPDTMNMNENLIESAITEKTKAIVPMHYAGVACNMEKIIAIAEKRGLKVVEDAAQGVMASYNGKFHGTMGNLGCYSFHETKNYTAGEGGALLINDEILLERAEIIREKGTNRSRFLRGQVDKYTWVDVGSSFLPSELCAAYLLCQLEDSEKINQDRLRSWHLYNEGLKPLAEQGKLGLPEIPEGCEHNAHMFYIKTRDISERSDLIKWLKEKGVQAVFHYVPLHSAEGGLKFGRFHGEDRYTTKESERLLRLPMYYGLSQEHVSRVISEICDFYERV